MDGTNVVKQSNSPEYEYFSNYYKQKSPISGDQYDAVLTFLLSKTDGNKEAAESLADGLLQLSYNQNIDPMRILQDFKKIEDNENLKAALLGILNSTRSNTSKIGYAKTPVQNPYVTRNIR